MGLYRQPGSRFWNYRFTFKGRRIFGSTKQRGRKLAERIFDHERAQYILGEKIKEAQPVKLKTLIDEYLENYSRIHKRSYQEDVSLKNRVLSYFGDSMASEVTQENLERYKAVRRKKKIGETGKTVSGATINREINFLKGVFTKAIAWKRVQENPVKGVNLFNERDRARVRYLTQDEQEGLLKTAPPDLRPIVLVALRTGARRGEILGMKWSDVDFVMNQITFPRTKNGKKRYIPLHGDVAELLSKMPRTAPYVFTDGRGGPMKWNGHTDRRWEKAVASAGITDFRFHDLRHCVASTLAMRGASLQAIAAILGHSSTRMSERYAHLSPNHISATLALLPSLVGETRRTTVSASTDAGAKYVGQVV
jgi:integrase